MENIIQPKYRAIGSIENHPPSFDKNRLDLETFTTEAASQGQILGLAEMRVSTGEQTRSVRHT